MAILTVVIIALVSIYFLVGLIDTPLAQMISTTAFVLIFVILIVVVVYLIWDNL